MLTSTLSMAGPVTLVSVNTSGQAASGENTSFTGPLSLSADGRFIAFSSSAQASTIVSGMTDTNGQSDVFLRDTLNGITKLISINATNNGTGNVGASLNPIVTPDGRFVVFFAGASNLVTGITDTNNTLDVFIRDLQTNTTELVSIKAVAPDAAGAVSGGLQVSDDGRYVAFQSTSTQLVAGFVDGNGAGQSDVYVRDRQTQTTKLVSGKTATTAGNGGGILPPVRYAMSANGRFILFLDASSDILPVPGSPGGYHAYVRDIVTDTTELVDQKVGGGYTNGILEAHATITADGRYVVFSTNGTNLVASPALSNFAFNIYRRDLTADTSTLVTINAAGTGGGDFDSYYPTIARDGRYVLVQSSATNLVNGVTFDAIHSDVFLRDVNAGTTRILSVSTTGTQSGDGYSFVGDISADGRYATFHSSSSNLVAGYADTPNGLHDVFRFDRVAGTLELESYNAAHTASSNGNSTYPSISSNGVVVFATTGNNLGPTDLNTLDDIYATGLTGGLSISGTVTANVGGALSGVTMTLAGGAATTTSTDAGGAYSFGGLVPGLSYTVTPSKTGYAFAPASRGYNGLGVSAINQTYVGTAPTPPSAGTDFVISGRVQDLLGTGVAGTTVTLSGSQNAVQTTNAEGQFAFTALSAGGNYTVTPGKLSFVFNPSNQTFNNLQADQTTTFFTAVVGVFTRYFAEGATGSFFDTQIALLNATGTSTTALVQFQKADGTVMPVNVTLPGIGRATVIPETVAGLESAEFSTVIESTQPVVADRTMTWDNRGYGSHAETSIAAPQTVWYLAEGATIAGFNLFYLIQNPSATQTANVTVQYLLPAPAAPIVKNYTVNPSSRFNIWVNLEDPVLDDAQLSAVITSTNNVPIIVERAMYLDTGGLLFGAGNESAAVSAPSTTWFLAEGATGPFFDLFILVANPSNTDATVEARFLKPGGIVITKTYTVAHNSRFNIWVDLEDAQLANTAVSTIITSTNSVPIIVERSMWWPGSTSEWYEGHNSAGAVQTGIKWGLAEGEVGGARSLETYILIANTSSYDGSAKVTLYFEGGTTKELTYPLTANSRTNVAVADIPEAAGKRFGAIVESLGATPAQIVVERAMYSTALGAVWAAGTNAVATRLQ